MHFRPSLSAGFSNRKCLSCVLHQYGPPEIPWTSKHSTSSWKQYQNSPLMGNRLPFYFCTQKCNPDPWLITPDPCPRESPHETMNSKKDSEKALVNVQLCSENFGEIFLSDRKHLCAVSGQKKICNCDRKTEIKFHAFERNNTGERVKKGIIDSIWNISKKKKLKSLTCRKSFIFSYV